MNNVEELKAEISRRSNELLEFSLIF